MPSGTRAVAMRRQSPAPSLPTARPASRSRAASSSVSACPMGLVGRRAPGSYRSTSVWVITVTTSRGDAGAAASAFCSDCWSM